MMKLTPVIGNSQKLDGGAMFGHAPKTLWQRWHKSDEQNRILLACRGLLIEVDDKKILLEAGIGVFFDPKMKERYGVVESDHLLLNNLRKLGVDESEITDVVLSHLHFDHAGGVLTAYDDNGKRPLALAFSKATFHVSEKAWKRALEPLPRDRSSFIPELQPLLDASGRLNIIGDGVNHELSKWCRFHFSDGHTPGLMITEVNYNNKTPVYFVTDLMPGITWMNCAIAMGYDCYPELLIEEKKALLNRCYEEKGVLCFTHDPDYAFVSLKNNSDGLIEVHERMNKI